jgi:hypothetical protein
MLRVRDLAFSLVILLLVPGIHYGVDSLIYSGQWYLAYSYIFMITIPATTIVICFLAKPKPFFISGVSLAFTLSLAACICSDILWPRHGNRGLDNFMGSFGALAGSLIALYYHKTSKKIYFKSYLVLGFLGATIGFVFVYQVSCNTVIYCGPLSLMYYTT